MSAPVDEAAVVATFGGCDRPQGADVAGERRTPTAGVDDQAGGQRPVGGLDAGDVRGASLAGRGRQQTRDADAAPDGDAGLGVGQPREAGLEHRSPHGDRVEVLVAGAPAMGDRGRLEVQQVRRSRPGADQVGQQSGQLATDGRVPPRQHQVRVPELADPGPGPGAPGVLGGGGRWSGIAFQHDDAVAGAGEEQSGGEAGESGADDDDRWAGHGRSVRRTGAHLPGHWLLTCCPGRAPPHGARRSRPPTAPRRAAHGRGPGAAGRC